MKSEKFSKYEPIAKTLMTVQNMHPATAKFDRLAKATVSGKFSFTGQSDASGNAPIKLNHIAASTHQNFFTSGGLSNVSTNSSITNATQGLGSPKMMKYPIRSGASRGLAHRSLTVSSSNNNNDNKGANIQNNINNAKINENGTYRKSIKKKINLKFFNILHNADTR
jgi:hypothetical protein